MRRGWWTGIVVLWYLLDSTHVTADKSYSLAASQRVPFVSLRGGSSVFPTRTPPTIRGRPGQTASLWNQPKAPDPFEDEDEEDIIESDESTREMINSFLTRESRNSFIGALNKDTFTVASIGTMIDERLTMSLDDFV